MGTKITKVKRYYYNEKFKKKKKIYEKKYNTVFKSSKIKKKTYFDKYPLKKNSVKVRVFKNGLEVYNATPRYSYIYKGVPGGFY